MIPMFRLLLAVVLACGVLAGCRNSTFGAPEVHGVSLVADGERPRLWVLTKLEEERTVAIGSGRRSGGWRTDTFYHFDSRPSTPRPRGRCGSSA